MQQMRNRSNLSTALIAVVVVLVLALAEVLSMNRGSSHSQIKFQTQVGTVISVSSGTGTTKLVVEVDPGKKSLLPVFTFPEGVTFENVHERDYVKLTLGQLPGDNQQSILRLEELEPAP